MASVVPTEAQEAHVLVAWLRVKGYTFVHVPNETGHSPEALRRAVRVKREGGSRGFPDYLIIKNKQLIAVELKRIKGSRTSPEQLQWLQELAACGVACAVCHGSAEAIEFIESVSISNSPTPSLDAPIF